MNKFNFYNNPETTLMGSIMEGFGSFLPKVFSDRVKNRPVYSLINNQSNRIKSFKSNLRIMRTIYSILIVCLFFVSNSLMAQEYVFKVLANKGSNQVKAISESAWKPVKTGTTLQVGDELKVSENAYLGLVHTSGKTVELKKPEIIDINELAASLNSGTSSVASKYADFVLNKMSESESARRNNLTATGAVTRATDNTSIKVFMPSSVEVLNPKAVVQWSELEGEGADQTYVVTLKNMFDEVIYSQETADSQMMLDLEDKKIAKERLVILNVTIKGDDDVQSGDYGIQRVSGEKSTALKSEMSELAGENSEETSLSHIMLASFYEKNNLLVDALTSYRKAIELSPEVDDFKTMYNDFIERNGLSN